MVRADESLSLLPVILLSARSDEAHKVLALERGADDYITKPFSSKELYARVKVRNIKKRTHLDTFTRTHFLTHNDDISISFSSKELYARVKVLSTRIHARTHAQTR